MPFYKDLVLASKVETELDRLKKSDRIRIVKGLLRLRAGLSTSVPQRTQTESLLLATWNIRELAPTNKGGKRTMDSYFFIAEIISYFDLVAVQEVRDDLTALQQVMRILGSDWQCVFTDVSAFANGGNQERMAFIFDTRKVRLSGLTGEIVLPPRLEQKQFARTPFMCGFKAGWTDFVLATVHIYYGQSTPDDPRRLQEITDVANFIRDRSEEKYAHTRNWILLGDFNIFAKTDATMKAIEEAGFKVPDALVKNKLTGSNVKKDKFYDQIAFKVDGEEFRAKERAGIFDYFEYVFREDEAELYTPLMPANASYATWRTFQMSDHLPMWVEIKIDYSSEYLEKKLKVLEEGA
ncbi:endonuclease/exonuclease/phosphatase family protein [Telluribacter humicola]|uniref:endonuclease/exonuclease/phosphatase family protein n=1 Tax=Telluribacter humicola TaxID=1720261 RepID=UPI001A96B12C|nr:endonuclease/exonuclease/phosphatase family protein [Telluribacter humicola]